MKSQPLISTAKHGETVSIRYISSLRNRKNQTTGISLCFNRQRDFLRPKLRKDGFSNPMKSIFKKNGRRILSAMLCLLMAVTALPMSAFAWTSKEGKSCTSSFGDQYVGSDGGNYYRPSSYTVIAYDSSGGISLKIISGGNPPMEIPAE